MEGFIVRRWLDRWDEGIKYNLQLIKEVRNYPNSNTLYQRMILKSFQRTKSFVPNEVQLETCKYELMILNISSCWTLSCKWKLSELC
jgi:hypothetical protein